MKTKLFLESWGGLMIGIAMDTMARNAIEVIRRQRTKHSVKQKLGYSGELDDVQTSADLAAQEVYARAIRELFPGYGLIAEESEMRIKCSLEMDKEAYFTVDPLDGTKAFIRSQSHGIGTMLALVYGDSVIAVCIGNVMTREVYGCIPDGAGAWRTDSEYEKREMKPNIGQKLSSQYALIRDRPEAHSTLVRRLLNTPKMGGLCKNYQTADGSVGLSMARLWNGEVGLAIQPETITTPWDATPVIGINQRLDIVQLHQNAEGYFISVPYQLIKEPAPQPETIYLHRKHLEEFMSWQEKTFERVR